MWRAHEKQNQTHSLLSWNREHRLFPTFYLAVSFLFLGLTSGKICQVRCFSQGLPSPSEPLSYFCKGLITLLSLLLNLNCLEPRFSLLPEVLRSVAELGSNTSEFDSRICVFNHETRQFSGQSCENAHGKIQISLKDKAAGSVSSCLTGRPSLVQGCFSLWAVAPTPFW